MSRIGGKVIRNLRYADDIVLMALAEEELLEYRVESAGKECDMLISGNL